MFESNFPVDKGSLQLRAYWNACKRLARGAGAHRESRPVPRDGHPASTADMT